MGESRVTILHIDDNETTRYIVTRVLQEEGYTVVEAETGAAGLQAIVNYQPALVILDVKLPDLNGFEVCRQIKSNPETAFIPVLHLSASFVKSQDKAEGLDSGADGYLVQPVEPIELLATVRSLLRIRRAEESAFTLAREWQTTFDAINDGVCLLDSEGRTLRCNRAMSQLFCKPAEEIVGCLHYELLQAELGIGDGTCFHLARETNERQVTELQAEGRWLAKTVDPIFDSQGKFTGAVLILSDITAAKHREAERQQAEADLRESEELKQRILESTHDCIKVLSLDGRILYLNKGGLQLLEIDQPESILDTDWVTFWQGEDQQKANSAIELAQAGNVGQFNGYCPTRKGQPRWWDVIVSAVRNPAGQVSQLLVVSRDITKQKQAEAEREQLLVSEQAARQQAETANRIKDEFLAVLSHELRSPLNPILGWSSLLRKGRLDAERTAHALETIERNAQLQVQLIEDLLDVSRILQGKLKLNPVPIDLAVIIRAALETVRLAAEAKSIQIQTHLDLEMGQVLGDSARLQQVVWNLLTNAIKFTPEGGQVEIELQQFGTHAQMQVRDTGKGIHPEFLPYVFEYFRQEDGATTRKFGGLGLGLAIVRQLVELHGGTVRVESAGEDQGATFMVQLPLLKQSMQLDSNPDDARLIEDEASLSGLKIVVVDDEPDSRDFVAFVLEQAGAEIVALSSASEVLRSILHIQPDLLVSDIGMPGIDGYMLIESIRTQLPAPASQVCAIALTAYAGEANERQVLNAGFQRHLSKPIDPAELLATVSQLVQ